MKSYTCPLQYWGLARKFTRSILLGAVASAPAVYAQNGNAPPGAEPTSFDMAERLARTDFEIPAVKDRPSEFDPDPGPDLTVERIETVRVELLGDGSTRTRPLDEPGLENRIEEAIAERGGEFTFGSLQELSRQLTAYLRDQGNLLATVYVPSQRVKNGVVRFEVLMGKLGQVQVEGNESYRAKHIINAFGGAVGETVNRAQIEESMLLLQEYPGLSVGGTFYPGQQLGETRLQLNVNEENRFDAMVLGDNYGSEFTGRERLGVHMEFNNPLKLTDKAVLDLVVTDEPSQIDSSVGDRFFGSFRYEMNPWSPRWGAGFEISNNNFVVGNVGREEVSQLEITGETEKARVFVTRKARSRTTKFDYEFGLTLQNAETFSRGELTAEDDLTLFDLTARIQHNDSFAGGGVNFLDLKYVQGTNGLGSMGEGDLLADVEGVPSSRTVDRGGRTREADASFTKIEYKYQRYQPTPAVNMLFTISGQWTEDPLVPVQQSGLGGPFNVRAYPTSAFLADKSEFYSVELMKSFRDDRFTVSAFVDRASGRNWDVLANERDEELDLTGIGLGLRWKIWRGLTTNMTVAWALDDDDDIPITGDRQGRFGTDSADRDDPMFYISLFWGAQ